MTTSKKEKLFAISLWVGNLILACATTVIMFKSICQPYTVGPYIFAFIMIAIPTIAFGADIFNGEYRCGCILLAISLYILGSSIFCLVSDFIETPASYLVLLRYYLIFTLCGIILTYVGSLLLIFAFLFVNRIIDSIKYIIRNYKEKLLALVIIGTCTLVSLTVYCVLLFLF